MSMGNTGTDGADQPAEGAGISGSADDGVAEVAPEESVAPDLTETPAVTSPETPATQAPPTSPGAAEPAPTEPSLFGGERAPEANPVAAEPTPVEPTPEANPVAAELAPVESTPEPAQSPSAPSTPEAAPAQPAPAEHGVSEAAPPQTSEPAPTAATSTTADEPGASQPASSELAGQPSASAPGPVAESAAPAAPAQTPTPTPPPTAASAATAAPAPASPSIGDSAPPGSAAVGQPAPASGEAAGSGPVDDPDFPGGTIVTGPVIEVSADEAVVDLGGDRTGVVSRRHYDEQPPPTLIGLVNVGDMVLGAVLIRDDPKGRVVLSRSWAVRKSAMDAMAKAHAEKSTIEAEVVKVVKGGLVLDVGVRGFLPRSLATLDPKEKLADLVGQTVTVRVLELDQEKNRVVLDRKTVLRKERSGRKAEIMAGLKKNEVRSGVVRSIADFGVFVDIGGAEGLVHLSELSWTRVENPKTFVKVGETVQVKILEVRKSKGRIRLSMRATTPDPISNATVGEVVEGTVTRLADFGAFVDIGGTEGLVHINQLSEHRVFTPDEVVIPGDRVFVKVIGVDRKRRRVDLSVTQAVQSVSAPPVDPNAKVSEDAPPVAEPAPPAEPASDEAAPSAEPEPAPTPEPASDETAAPDTASGDEPAAADAASSEATPAEAASEEAATPSEPTADVADAGSAGSDTPDPAEAASEEAATPSEPPSEAEPVEEVGASPAEAASEEASPEATGEPEGN